MVSRHGALVLSPDPLELGTAIRITNLETGLSQPFRVVWCGGEAGDLFKVGIEMVEPDAAFWGLTDG